MVGLLLVALLVAAAVGITVVDRSGTGAPPQALALIGPISGPVSGPAAAPAAETQPLPGPAEVPPVAPSFDVARVSPSGSMVIAGHAAPGAEVTLQTGPRLLDHVTTDQRGAWVMVPQQLLPPGASVLTLSARLPDGRAVAGDASVVLVVPAPQPAQAASEPAAPPLALLLPANGPSRTLQLPGGKLGMDTVDYDDKGAIRFSGSAPASAPVRVYVDNVPAGDASADAAGRWTLSPGAAVAVGKHQLRVDQLDGLGHVSHRVELPFQRDILTASQVGSQTVVQPGQNLWRLARRAYGSGLRYTVIYAANRDQIRDARLIYPGQVFAMPPRPRPSRRRR